MTAAQKEFMPWTDAFMIGERTIDSQHKLLVSLVNQLYEAMRTGQGRTALQGILKSLIQYTQTHFRYEESVLRQHAYAGLNEHISQHRKLEETVMAFQREFEDGAAGITVELMDFLSNWLRCHILENDKKYAPFIA